MNYAQLNERITVQMQHNAYESTMGQDEWEYLDKYRCWAKVEQLSATEAIVDDRAVPVIVRQFTVRISCAISNTDRVVYKAENYEVLAIDNTLDRMYTKVTGKLIV